MATDGSEPIEDDELLYRRVPVSTGWYDGTVLSPQAFRPRPDEATGISVYRAKYKSVVDAAQGTNPRGYFVAVFRAGDLRAAGIDVAPRPLDGDPGHAEIPSLVAANRRSPEAADYMAVMAKRLCLEVDGRFVTPQEQDPEVHD